MHNNSYQIAMAFRFNWIYLKEVWNNFIFYKLTFSVHQEILSFAIRQKIKNFRHQLKNTIGYIVFKKSFWSTWGKRFFSLLRELYQWRVWQKHKNWNSLVIRENKQEATLKTWHWQKLECYLELSVGSVVEKLGS